MPAFEANDLADSLLADAELLGECALADSFSSADHFDICGGQARIPVSCAAHRESFGVCSRSISIARSRSSSSDHIAGILNRVSEVKMGGCKASWDITLMQHMSTIGYGTEREHPTQSMSARVLLSVEDQLAVSELVDLVSPKHARSEMFGVRRRWCRLPRGPESNYGCSTANRQSSPILPSWKGVGQEMDANEAASWGSWNGLWLTR